MQELRQSTQVKVVIGPAVAVGDGFTPVTTLTLSGADEAEILKHDAAAVTDISGATFAAITSADGYYNLTITTSLSDTLGLLTVLINDDSLILPIRKDFMVISAYEWDRKYTANSAGLTGVITYGTAQGGTADTIQLAAATAIGANDRANGMTVYLIGGTGANQSRQIYNWTDATDTADISPSWVTDPSSDTIYVVAPTPPSATVAGALPEVNVKSLDGNATAFANLVDDYDGTGYAGGTINKKSNSVQVGSQTASASGTVTFPNGTIASTTNRPEVNIKEVNDIEVDGAGTAGDPWGPV